MPALSLYEQFKQRVLTDAKPAVLKVEFQADEYKDKDYYVRMLTAPERLDPAVSQVINKVTQIDDPELSYLMVGICLCDSEGKSFLLPTKGPETADTKDPLSERIQVAVTLCKELAQDISAPFLRSINLAACQINNLTQKADTEKGKNS